MADEERPGESSVDPDTGTRNTLQTEQADVADGKVEENSDTSSLEEATSKDETTPKEEITPEEECGSPSPPETEPSGTAPAGPDEEQSVSPAGETSTEDAVKPTDEETAEENTTQTAADVEDKTTAATTTTTTTTTPTAAEMADTQVQMPAQSLQPPTQEASKHEESVCKYRWAKVVPTNSQRIIFFSSAHPKDPVFLHWSEENAAYFSEEKHVPCGDYAGHVIVEGRTYPVEGFHVRTYTFEVDLFVKEDVIEDEVATSNSLAEEIKFREQQQQYQKDAIDTYQDISTAALTSYPKMEENGTAEENGIRHNSKYEDLLRQQLQRKEALDASLESELALSQKSDQSFNGSASKRLTPVGDIDKETFQDGYSSLPMAGGSTGFDTENLGRSFSRSTPDVRQDYDLERCSVKSELGSSRHSLTDAPLGDVLSHPKSPKSPSRPGSGYSGGGSGRPTPQREFYGEDTHGGDKRKSPVRSAEGSVSGRPGSRSSGHRTPVDTRIDDVLGSPGSRSLPGRQTETISDVLGSEAIIASPVRSHTLGSARQTPDREVGGTNSSHTSLRGTPQRETNSTSVRGSQEQLYVSQDLPPPASGERSLTSSITPSRHSSRAQSLSSLTSEQELSQFFDTNKSRTGSELGRTPVNFDTHPEESATLPPIMRDRDRPSSLPVYSTRSSAGADKRSFTPDHRLMAVTTGGESELPHDLAGRVGPRSVTSSRASSRTVTPVNIGGQESQRVRELEDTIATLRKLLGSREQEVHDLNSQIRDLKDINQSLKHDLEHARSRRTSTGPEELEQQYQQLLKEKEILAAEVVKLRDRLEASRGSKVDSFFSGNTISQQKRIDELEAHIRDLRDASDATIQKLTHSEMHVRELLEENNKLQSAKSLHVKELQEGRAGRFGDRQHLFESEQRKADVRVMRDRNYAVQDENLRLTEGRAYPLRSSDVRSSLLREPASDRNHLASSIRSDDGTLHRPSAEPTSLRESTHRLSDHITSPSRSQVLAPPHHSSARPVLDRSYGSDSFPVTSSRDSLPRSHDRSFGSDRDPREGVTSYSRSRLENANVGKEHLHASQQLRYKELSSEEGTELRRTDPGRYDLLRSRPDGEVSEKLNKMDNPRHHAFSSERLKSFDREREADKGQAKIIMSTERLRILEEAERDRERRGLLSSAPAGHRVRPAANPISSEDIYHKIREQTFGRTNMEREKYFDAGRQFVAHTDSGRQRRLDSNLSDDSDSTAVLMSYGTKAEPLANPHEKERMSFSERGKWQDVYGNRAYMRDREVERDKDLDFRDLQRTPYKESNGDDSDTATDILLNANPSTNPGHSRHRHHHLSGSDASISSDSDPCDLPDSLRHRSRSADTKGKYDNPHRSRKTTTLRPAASVERLGGGKTVTISNAGFRSVTPQPLTTQHNRGAVVQQMQQAQQASLASSLTQGLRPFAPRSPADVRPEDVVKFSRQGGKLSQGTVKFVGHLPGRTDVYLGVELYKEEGKHDGTFEGIRYFKCKPNKGVFVAFNKVVMAWAPS